LKANRSNSLAKVHTWFLELVGGAKSFLVEVIIPFIRLKVETEECFKKKVLREMLPSLLPLEKILPLLKLHLNLSSLKEMMQHLLREMMILLPQNLPTPTKASPRMS